MTLLGSESLSIKKFLEFEYQFLLNLREFIDCIIENSNNLLLHFIKWVSLLLDCINHTIYFYFKAFTMQNAALTHFIIANDWILVFTLNINTCKIARSILSTLSIGCFQIDKRFIIFLNKINMIIFRVLFFHFKGNE